MQSVADALLTTERTRARNAKVAALAALLEDVAAHDDARLPFVARLLTGTLLPTEDERTLGVGGALLFEAACDVTGATPAELGALARRAGDLGTAVCEALTQRIERESRGDLEPALRPGLPLEDAERIIFVLAGSSSRADKLRALTEALTPCSPNEARYFVRAITGEMRVGAREGIALDAISKAFKRPLADVRRAAGFVSDVGELARLAHEDRLAEAAILLGRPVGFMLATPIETARGANLTTPHAVEDKIDGIRAQAHIDKDVLRLFARGKGSVTAAFPDLTAPLSEAAKAGRLKSAIVDGEIVVVASDGRPRPFSAIQPRLKKTTPDEDLVRDHPIAYLVYDILFEDGASLLDLPFHERRARLVAWAKSAPAPLVVHESRPLGQGGAGEVIDKVIDAEFTAARARGYEGLVLKRLDAVYAAGVRGFAWLKVKKALATLDVVVVAAQRGYGRRAGVLSDLTFAVRSVAEDGTQQLLTIGKAYSGLTDVEIATMTEQLLAIATAEEKHGFVPVRPEIVIEVGFDGLQRSDRHSSGFALRFPRIERIRDDKKPEDADTLDAVKALWEAQLASGHREDIVAKDRQASGEKKKGRKSGRRPDIRKKTEIASRQLRLFDDD